MSTLENHLKIANIILYCREWEQAVHFYKNRLHLPVTAAFDWFVEFQLTDSSRMSIADEKRASRKSNRGKSITIALEVDDIQSVWHILDKNGLQPTEIKDHPWNALVFYIFDPEGHRIEIWQASQKEI